MELRSSSLGDCGRRACSSLGARASGQLDDLMTAIDRFEAAVIARGGDLFVNTPFSNPPENPDFVIPLRVPGEDPEAYAARINAAAERLETVDL